MFVVSYVEELNGKNNNTWEDEYDRELDIVKDLIETSEGLPSNPYVSIRAFAYNLVDVKTDISHTIEEDDYKITINVKVV